MVACSPTSPLKRIVGLDDEGDACAAKAIGERLPGLHWKHNAEVGDGNVVAVDGVVVGGAVGGGGLEVRDDLVAEEIEVDPLRGAAALGTAQGGSVEGASGVEVVNRKGDVKRREGHGGLLASIIRCRETGGTRG